MEKREPSYTVGGYANQYSHYGEQCGDSLKNCKQSCLMTQQSHCWAYTPRKPELKETHVPQCSLQYCRHLFKVKILLHIIIFLIHGSVLSQSRSVQSCQSRKKIIILSFKISISSNISFPFAGFHFSLGLFPVLAWQFHSAHVPFLLFHDYQKPDVWTY